MKDAGLNLSYKIFINNLNIRKCQTIIMHNGEISLNRLTILMDRTKTKISMFFRMNDLIEEK